MWPSGQMSEFLAWTAEVWSLSCLHLSHWVSGIKPEVRGHHRGPSRSKVYHSLRGPAAITQALQSTCSAQLSLFSSLTFSNPSKWLGQNSWQEKQTVGCGALSHQLEISLWKDSLLLSALSTNQRAPPESRHPEQLPPDPASGCWFILFGLFFFQRMATFDRSGSRIWMRSIVRLSSTAWEKSIKSRRGCRVHWDMWKMAHFGAKRGAIHAKSIPSSRPRYPCLCSCAHWSNYSRPLPSQPHCPFRRLAPTSSSPQGVVLSGSHWGWTKR